MFVCVLPSNFYYQIKSILIFSNYLLNYLNEFKEFRERLNFNNSKHNISFIKALHNELQCHTGKHFPTNILTKIYNTIFPEAENTSLNLSG